MSVVEAVDTRDEADLMQWLLASEVAQDVVYHSLTTAGGTAPGERPPSGGRARNAPAAHRFSTPSAPVPPMATPPAELLELERKGRVEVQKAFESSIACFRHLHPAYLRNSYDWVLAGPRLTLERDRAMFIEKDRHLPTFLQQKRKLFFSRELGHAMEVKHSIEQQYQQQQQQSTSPVIHGAGFVAIPTRYTNNNTQGFYSPSAAPSVVAALPSVSASSVKLSETFGRTLYAHEAVVRETIHQSESQQRTALLAKERCALARAQAVAATRHYYDNGGHRVGSPQRMMEFFCWETTSIVARDVSAPRPPSDVERHLPEHLRKPRPHTAYSTPQKPPAGGVPQSAKVASNLARPATAAVTATTTGSRAEAASVGSVLPRAVANYRVQSAPAIRASLRPPMPNAAKQCDPV